MSLMLQAIGYAVVVTFGLIAVFRLRQNRGSDNQRRPAAQTK